MKTQPKVDYISACQGTHNYGEIKCEARLLADGTVVGASCGEPCSWIMRKSGHGEPPFLSDEELVTQMARLLARRRGPA